MSRYETFVVRIWVDDSPTKRHGEIRHLSSGMGLRFRQVRDAVKFIERFAGDRVDDRPTRRSAPPKS